jgi:hypothetical protein
MDLSTTLHFYGVPVSTAPEALQHSDPQGQSQPTWADKSLVRYGVLGRLGNVEMIAQLHAILGSHHHTIGPHLVQLHEMIKQTGFTNKES